MAKKQKPDAPEADPELLLSALEAADKINERIAKGEEIGNRQVSTTEDLQTAKNDFKTWDAYNTDLLKRLFTTAKYSGEYSWWAGAAFHMDASPQQRLQYLRQDVAEQIRRLESIRERLELVPLAAGVTTGPSATARSHTNKAFVVHGHDEGIRESVARFLEKLGIQAIILHEQVSAGRTVVEKLEHYSDVDFAVVLLTPDDVGAAKDSRDHPQPRARQNVILELGYFVGRLGRNRVCALYAGSLELPSDIIGVVYVQLDAAGAWRLALAREMRAGGFKVDMNLAV